MLDPIRETELVRYLRQFSDRALRGRGPAAEAAITEAAVVVHSVLAGAAQRWNAALPVSNLLSGSLTTAFAYLSLEDRIQVSRVCRSWRRLALSEPRLWNRVALKPRSHKQQYDADVIYWRNSDFMHLMLGWSAGDLLDLIVYELGSGPYADAFFNALPGVVGRLRSLRVEFMISSPDLDRFMDVLSTPAPCLEHLTLQNNGWGSKECREIIPPFCAPRLRSLSITGAASLSSSLDPFVSVSKLTLGRDVSRVAPTSWTKHLFALFPNVREVHIPDFGGCSDFPDAPSPAHGIQSLTFGHESSSNPQAYLPPYHLERIRFVRLRWPAHKAAKALLETFGAAPPRVLAITGFGCYLTLSDAAGAVRRECEPPTKDLAVLLAEPALFATVTDVTLTDRCAPDPVWKLVAALPAMTHLTILVAESGLQHLLTRDDASRGGQAQAARHPSLERVIFKEDPEWDTTANVPKGPYPPTVFAARAERVLRARLGLTVAPDGSSSPRVISRGVLIAGEAHSALKIIREEA